MRYISKIIIERASWKDLQLFVLCTIATIAFIYNMLYVRHRLRC